MARPERLLRRCAPRPCGTTVASLRCPTWPAAKLSNSSCLCREFELSCRTGFDRFMVLNSQNDGAPGEIASALRASSLRDHRRFAPVSNLACGQVVELVLFMSGVRIELS